MKIAVFHNFMDNIGGAEIVSLTLARHFSAQIYTTNIDPEKIIKMGFEDVLPKITSIGKVPKKAPFKQQLTLYKFRRLNLKKEYDFYIISGDWAMSAVVNHHPNLWYIHSPLNELWEFKEYIKKNTLSFWQKPIFDLWVFINRKLSLKYSKNTDNWVCNSQNTSKRVQKFYKKTPKIIHPPIDTELYKYNKDQGYWLSVNRLFQNKRVELQLEAFKKIPEKKLIIVGSYEVGARHFEKYSNLIQKNSSQNIEIKHWVSADELIDIYSNCKGFITTSFNEDFGMTVVEAMASGKPVIAPNEGGYKESIINNETGLLLDKINPKSILEAINKIDIDLSINPNTYKEKCIAQAKKFDLKIFTKKISDIIEKYKK